MSKPNKNIRSTENKNFDWKTYLETRKLLNKSILERFSTPVRTTDVNKEQAEENKDSAPTAEVLNEDFPTLNTGKGEQIQRPTGLESAWATGPKVVDIDTTPTPDSESNVAKLTPLNREVKDPTEGKQGINVIIQQHRTRLLLIIHVTLIIFHH